MKRSIKFFAMVLTIGLAVSARAEPVLQGDPARGRALYRLNCSACHGAQGRGDGPLAHNFTKAPPPALNAPAFLMQRGDADLQRAITEGGAAVGRSAAMPAFGERFGELDAWDIIAFERAGQPAISDFFPDAARYTAKEYALGPDSLKRLAPVLGTLKPDETKITLVSVFGGKKSGDGPVFVPQDPRFLDSLKPKKKLGYLAFEPFTFPGLSKPVLLSIAFDREGFISALRADVSSLDAKERARIEKLLSGYSGQGGKAYDYAELKPAKLPGKDAKAAGEVAKALTRAYYRALEGAVMFDKEERERHWAD